MSTLEAYAMSVREAHHVRWPPSSVQSGHVLWTPQGLRQRPTRVQGPARGLEGIKAMLDNRRSRTRLQASKLVSPQKTDDWTRDRSYNVFRFCYYVTLRLGEYRRYLTPRLFQYLCDFLHFSVLGIIYVRGRTSLREGRVMMLV